MNQPAHQAQAPRSRPQQRRKPQSRRPQAADIWRPHAPLPPVEPIAAPHEVGALLRSLGDPPINGGAAAANHFTMVVERAAAVALALAFSADLLDDPNA
jgi:hypothetical protein